MKCIVCGEELETGKAYCPKCGALNTGNSNTGAPNMVAPNLGQASGGPQFHGSENQQSEEVIQKKSTVSLVMGILALLFDLLTCWSSLLIFPEILAMVFGILAITNGSKGAQKGINRAMTGKTLGIVAVSVWILCVIFGILGSMSAGSVAGLHCCFPDLF